MDINLNALKIFIKVAELGSLTQAGKYLGLPKSRVSRSLKSLEEDLGIDLVKRSTRSVALTEPGKILFQSTQGLLYQLEKQLEVTNKDKEQVVGVLSISAPVDIGELLLPKLLASFAELHPKIKFRLVLSSDYVDLVRQEIDVAIRIGNLSDSALKQKKLSTIDSCFVASKKYAQIYGVPDAMQDLSKHKIIGFYNENQNDILNPLYKKYGIKPYLRCNSYPLIKKLILNEKGIGILPSIICREEVKSGELVRILPSWKTKKTTVQAVYSPSANLPYRIKVFLNFLETQKDYFN